MPTHETPRVYLACLASYNAGRLHGEWCDATDLDEISECSARVLKTSRVPGAEEIAIHDHEHFGDIIGEYTPFEAVAEWGALIEEHGADLVCGLHGHGLTTPDDVREALEDRRAGEAETWADYAAEYVESCVDLESLPELIRHRIDYEGIARDFECSGDLFAIRVGGTLHFFHSQ